ncbi:MAG: hypothetical protein FJY55_16300 [Betaproteobacteria bacterium]|nr:hypothetical protein [Betaproteobacteria bacterium]
MVSASWGKRTLHHGRPLQALLCTRQAGQKGRLLQLISDVVELFELMHHRLPALRLALGAPEAPSYQVSIT